MSILDTLSRKLNRSPAAPGPASMTALRALPAKSANNDTDFFVFGLHYDTPLLADTKTKELQRFTTRNKATHACFISIKSSDGRNESLMTGGRLQPAKGCSYYAGAAAVCQHNKSTDRTYLIELGPDLYVAFQGNSGGLLRVGSETMGDAEAIEAVLTEWQEEHSLGAISFLLSPASPLHDFVARLGVTSRATDLLNFKPLSTTLLSKPKTPYAQVVLIALVVVVVGLFSAFKGSEYLQKLDREKSAEKELAERRASFLSQVNATISSSWSGTHQDVYTHVFLPLMQNIALKRVGFKVVEVQCDIPQRSCSSRWQRVTGSYFEMLSTTNPSQVSVTEDYEQFRLIEMADFDKAKTPPPSFSAFPKRKSFLFEIGDILSEFKLAKMATAGPVERSAPLVAWSGTGSPPLVPSGGKLTLAGDVGMINAMLAMPPNTTPKKLTLTAGKGSSFSFNLESTYYVSPDL